VCAYIIKISQKAGIGTFKELTLLSIFEMLSSNPLTFSYLTRYISSVSSTLPTTRQIPEESAEFKMILACSTCESHTLVSIYSRTFYTCYFTQSGSSHNFLYLSSYDIARIGGSYVFMDSKTCIILSIVIAIFYI